MEIQLYQPYSYCQLGQRGNQEDARYPDVDAPQGVKPAFIVCDGVGGQDKGEVASRTVADAMGQYVAEHVDLTRPFTAADFGKVLDYAYHRLNEVMTSDTRQMATTMTFVCFNAAGAFCAHMGDSRIYQVRPGTGIMYQSEDHSLVNALVHSGNISPEEAINHPQSNVITRCITYVPKDAQRPQAAMVQITDVEPGDYFLLCTDGVLHQIDDEQLYDILASEASDQEKMAHFAKLSRNSSDNNTAYLLHVSDVIRQPGEKDEADTAPLAAPQAAQHESKMARFFKKIFG